jgi:hypothetical protein
MSVFPLPSRRLASGKRLDRRVGRPIVHTSGMLWAAMTEIERRGAGLRHLAVAVALVAACAAAPKEGAKTPAGAVPPSPCMVDEKGQVTDAGGRAALCCPELYVASENMESNACPPGFCCHISVDMSIGSRMPTGVTSPYRPPDP